MSDRLRISALVGAIVYGILAVLSVFPATMAVMTFDSPLAAQSALIWAFFFGIAAIPFVLAISALVLIIAFFKRTRKAAIVGLPMPVVLFAYNLIVAVS